MSTKNNSLQSRMKNYESVSKSFLMPKVPAIIRLDGKAFSTFTRGLKKPFDEIIAKTMQQTMRYLCENIQGCVFGYTQSDEITLVLTDYATIATDNWMGYNVQKMTSISASMATLAFNMFFIRNVEFIRPKMKESEYSKYEEKFNKAMFDSRVFSLPKEEVVNCLIWRQQDAVRNSIQAVGQSYFTQKQFNGKSLSDIQEMLFSKKNINWNDYPIEYKRGSCCFKREIEKNVTIEALQKTIVVNRRIWTIDTNIPIFTQDRNYIEKWV